MSPERPVAVTEDPTAEEPSLRRHIASGVRWGSFDQGAQALVRFAVMVVLARIVAPRDFGLMGMVWVVVNLLALATGLGMGEALVQRRDLRREHVAVAFTASALTGLLLAGLTAVLAVPASHLFGERRLVALLLVMTVVFLASGVERTPNDMLVRAFRFREYYLSSTMAAIAGAAVGIVLGAMGHGIWALVSMAVAEAVSASALAWLFAIRTGVWRPALGMDRTAFAEMIGYGANVTAARMIAYGQSNTDNLVVGKVLGPIALGYYALAYRTMLLPISKVARVIGSTAFPAFAAVQHDVARLRALFTQANRYVALICFPVTVGLAVTAPVLVPVAFGEQWVPAVRVVQLLALAGPFISITSLDNTLYEGVGKPEYGLRLAVAELSLYIPAFVIGVQFGIEGVAAGLLISGYGIIPLLVAVRARVLGTSVTAQLRPFARLLAATGAMALAASGARSLLPASTSDLVTLATMVTSGAAAYLVAIRLLAPGLLTGAGHDLVRRSHRGPVETASRPAPAR